METGQVEAAAGNARPAARPSRRAARFLPGAGSYFPPTPTAVPSSVSCTVACSSTWWRWWPSCSSRPGSAEADPTGGEGSASNKWGRDVHQALDETSKSRAPDLPAAARPEVGLAGRACASAAVSAGFVPPVSMSQLARPISPGDCRRRLLLLSRGAPPRAGAGRVGRRSWCVTRRRALGLQGRRGLALASEDGSPFRCVTASRRSAAG